MKNVISLIICILIHINTYTQEILTAREVFDFDINDQFQYKDNAWFINLPNAERLTVTDKYYSQNNDTVFYTFSYNNYVTDLYSSPDWSLTYHFSTGTKKVFYTKLDTPIFKYIDHLSYDTIYKYWGTSEWFLYDSIMEISSVWCNTLINGFHCNTGEFEPSYYEYEYGKGIGLIRILIWNGWELNPQTVKYLFYYSKGDESCGTPDLTTEICNNSENNHFHFFPNPAKNEIYIRIESYSELLDIDIYDMHGRLLESYVYNPKEPKIDISDLLSGIYYLRFYYSNYWVTKMLIKL